MKKILALVILAASLFFSCASFAQETPTVNLYLFWSSGCPHCHKEIAFLETLGKIKPNLNIVDFEVSKDSDNVALYMEVGKYLGADTGGVPFTIIGSQYFVGYNTDETTGQVLTEAIEKVERGEDYDILAEFFEPEGSGQIGDSQPPPQIPQLPDDQPPLAPAPQEKPQPAEPGAKLPNEIVLPFLGTIDPQKLSLPALTFIIALVDGFNPCAMWVLIFLISLLLGFKDRKRMWILGATFIAASTLVYFLFMTAWLNFFLFFGFIVWVRLLVGLVALYSGYRNLRSYLAEKNGGCEVTQDEKRLKILQKIKDITQRKSLWLAMGGIVLLAFAVNLIEALCSAGLPAVYTQILTLNALPVWQYYLYIAFYQVIFMLDDMLVFVVAMVTLNSVGIQSKYARWVKLIGGVIMLIIGILLIFKPELLLFG